jgi:integrase
MQSMAMGWFHDAETKRVRTPPTVKPHFSPRDVREELEEQEAILTNPDDEDCLRQTQAAARSLLVQHGFEIDPTARELLDLAELLRRGMLEHTRRASQEAAGNYSRRTGDDLFAEIRADDPPLAQPVARTISLSRLITLHRAEPSRANLSPKSKHKDDAQARLFEEVFGGSKDVRAIGRGDVGGLVDLLTKLPTNAKKRFPRLSLVQAAEMAAASGFEPISRLTASSYLSAFSALMEFAISRGWRDDNPAKQFSVGSDGVAARDRRRPFSKAQLVKIFDAPLYRGCLDDNGGYAKPGSNVVRRGRFWVPLISLFTGMRMNEICQLHVEDIEKQEGVDVIVVRSDEEGTRRVKTAAGERVLPIHSELIRCGLLTYRQQVAAQGEVWLFPELTAAKASGYRSDNLSKWFAHFLEKAGAKAPRTSFHSFRHNYRDALREAGISEDRVRALGGWSSGGTENLYGSGFRPSTLAAENEKISFPDLCLKHLHI